ncbi:FxDxF family PEP-CTERM protein [Deefgea rivuli]|uniref:FxDxF family PEP-CTERM protein n=1 Tax=Deefgea rivuli TaxID=400948 RepID=UPI003570B95E
MIKTLVATALLSVSFAASAAVTVTPNAGNTFSAGSGKISQHGDKNSSFSFVTGTQYLDAGFFSSESFVTFSSQAANKFSELKAWYQIGSTTYLFDMEADSKNKIFNGSFAENQSIAAGNYTFGFSGKLSNGTASFSYNTVTAPVPEPETYALMGIGLMGLLAARRRKVNAA